MANINASELNLLEPDRFLNQEMSITFNKEYYFKWLVQLNLDESKTCEDWARVFVAQLCLVFQAKAALFYTYTPARKRCILKAHIHAVLSAKLPRSIKLDESNLKYLHQDPNITLRPVDAHSAFHFADKASSTDMLLLFPILKGNEVIAYAEFLLQNTLQEPCKVFARKLGPLLANSFEKVLLQEAQQKRIQELESINQAMEASQEAMHENAVKFMRVHQKLKDSINYAQKMQKAILPREERLLQSFEDIFIMYEPKDTVSGDFYWYSQIEYTFLAVIDCTGHGVPGAFMSMIGNTLLNEIVNSKRIYNPSKILEMLHAGVRSSLNQDKSQNIDGMEVCLCRFTRDENFNLVLTYAGAKRPLYHVRNGELFKIPGTRRSIGGVQSDYPEEFETHTLQLQEGDMLYLSTDGFKDTPNHKRKSLGRQTLQKLLLEYANLPLAEQKKNLWGKLIEHQEGAAIRDDITLIGIRV